ncbi:MAG TPA: cytochrome c oxidase subunit 3 [Allosphingosinicella sp.]|jgi:heme/copper-type cytochrome/quinol oxidase subunit 3
MLQPHFTGDLASLPTHAFGHRSSTWWAVMAFFLIEGTFFVLAIAAYFFLMNQEQAWPPPPFRPPDLLAGTLFTILLLLSEIPNTILKKAAEKGQLRKVRRLMVVMCVVGTLLLVIRGFEFLSLNVLWYDNAYGSIVWCLLFLHATHILTDWGDTVVLTALMHTRHGMEGRRFVDVAENAMYWRFVWLCWLPIYLLLYWLPRWVD